MLSVIALILSVVGFLFALGAILITDHIWDHHEANGTVWLGVITVIMGVAGAFFNVYNVLDFGGKGPFQ